MSRFIGSLPDGNNIAVPRRYQTINLFLVPWAITFAVNNSTRVPVNETSKNRGLEKLRSGTIRGEEEIARRLLEIGSRSITSKVSLDRYREIQISKIRIIIRVNDSFSVVCR